MAMYDLESALEYAKDKKIEGWVHEFLRHENNNIEFSDGLKLEKRSYFGPMEMKLKNFERCCGPEPDIKYTIHEGRFESHVENMMKSYKKGWKVPPLIINFSEGKFEINDGNHRFEALIRLGLESYPVIIWTTGSQDISLFLSRYHDLLDC